MPLEYPYTCQDIDRGIRNAQVVVRDHLCDFASDLISELSDGTTLDQYAEKYAKNICEELNEIFEAVRKTNIEMREAADKQIEDLESKLENTEQ